MKNTIENIIEHVLVQNRISNYDKKDLELQLQIHPNYPSFQSITDTLDYFDIDNIAVEVPIDALDQLPKSFVSLVKVDNSEEIVSILHKNDNISLKFSSLKKKKYTYTEFKEIWIPKVIAVEHASKNSLFIQQSFLQKILVSALLISLIFTIINSTESIEQIIFLALSITGVIFSFYAVRESLGIHSQTMQQFCTSIKNSNCSEVINNNTGKLLKNFSLADASLVFFSIITLYHLFYGYNSTLLLPTIIGVPFIVFSIYSQALIIKKWCTICLVIASIVTGLIITSIFSLPFSFDLSSIFGLTLISAAFTLAYLYSKENIVENKDFKSDNIKLNHFKRDPQIFDHLLSLSEKVHDTGVISNEIILGNPNAQFKIISLTNPMCGYCKEAFESYSKVIKSMGERVQVIIRLRVAIDDLNNEATQVSLRLLEIYHDKGSDSFINAYNAWFKDRTFSIWVKNYGSPKNKKNHTEVLKKQSEWAEKNSLHYTPASLMNGTLYPKKYSYKEFFHFTNLMIESHDEIMLNEKEKTMI